jgi:hypothetical protein
LTTRSLQPTQVRIAGIPGTCRLARVAMTASSLPRPRVSGYGRNRAGALAYSGPYSGAWAAGPAGEGPAGTAASDLMSIRQPVSLAASLAFWPSLPIASDSW